MVDNACPDADVLGRFCLGRLSEQQLEAIGDHVADCISCRDTLEELERVSDGVVDALRRSVTPDRLAAECGPLVDRVGKLIDSPAVVVRPRLPPAPDEAPAGESLGQYILLAKLGAGGMGTVYKALHTRLRKIVALKVLDPSRSGQAAAIRRFQCEMEAAGKLQHPHIITAHDAGEVDGTHFLVMEYIEGADLSRLARWKGPLAVADACELVRQAALGLEHAHQLGLVHRDIKPSNLMLNNQGQVKVLDLGLSLQPFMPAGGELTSPSHTMGTADYMAPEQAGDSRAVDARTDIYSLGCTLYKLLTGRALFDGPEFTSPLKKMLAHSAAPRPSLDQARPDVPRELLGVLDRMLAIDPAGRFSTAAEVAERLADFSSGANLPALLVGLPPAEESVPGRLSDSARDRLPSPVAASNNQNKAARVGLRRGLGLAAVAAAVFAMFMVSRFQSGAEHATGQVAPTVQDPQRQAAEWVLRTGGWLVLGPGEREVTKLSELPASGISVDKVFLNSNPQVTDANLKELVGLKDLRYLSLSGSPVSDDGVTFLVQTFPRIMRVDVAATRITDAALRDLSRLDRLATLRIDRAPISDAGLVHLAGQKSLRVLFLCSTRVSAAGIERLRECPNLRDLHLSGTGLGDEAVETLEKFSNLKVLALNGTAMTAAAVTRIRTALPQCHVEWTANGPGDSERRVAEWVLRGGYVQVMDGQREIGTQKSAELPQGNFTVAMIALCDSTQFTDADLPPMATLTDLRQLRIWGTAVSDAGVHYIVTAFPKLSELDLSGTQVTDAALAELANLQQLAVLRIDRLPITDTALRLLAGHSSLHTLSLNRTKVSGDGLRWVAECPQLRELYLNETRVGDEAEPVLARMAGLQVLQVKGTNLTAATVERLRATLGSCRVEWMAGDELAKERREALWALRLGGKVVVAPLSGASVEVGDVDHLPKELFQVEQIDLRGSPRLQDAMLENVTGLAGLQELDLGKTATTDAALKYLRGLKSLRVLKLSSTRITDACLEILGELPRADRVRAFATLRRLDLKHSRLTPAAVAKLRGALPDCEIRYSAADR